MFGVLGSTGRGISAGAAPYPTPNAQYRLAFLSPDTSPVRVQGGQRLVARRSGRNFLARGSILRLRPRQKTWRSRKDGRAVLSFLFVRSDKPRLERD